jgi:hypothetical protein
VLKRMPSGLNMKASLPKCRRHLKPLHRRYEASMLMNNNIDYVKGV